MEGPQRKRDIVSDEHDSGTHQVRRASERVTFGASVSVEHNGVMFEAVAENLGLGGMFVSAGVVPAYGSRVDLLMSLPTHRAMLRLPGVVRWTKTHGFGLQFLQLGALETHAISRLVESLRATEPDADH